MNIIKLTEYGQPHTSTAIFVHPTMEVMRPGAAGIRFQEFKRPQELQLIRLTKLSIYHTLFPYEEYHARSLSKNLARTVKI